MPQLKLFFCLIDKRNKEGNDTMEETYQDRVSSEKRELGKKLTSLRDFMHSQKYVNLSAPDQGLLMVQLVAMQNYSEVLLRRIELFQSTTHG